MNKLSISALNSINMSPRPRTPPPPPPSPLPALIHNFTCALCREILKCPVHLPCSHIYCSACLRLHLSHRSLCPSNICPKPVTTRDLTALRQLDRWLEPLRPPSPSAASSSASHVRLEESEKQSLPFLLDLGAGSSGPIRNALRDLSMPTDGPFVERYKNFVISWNANLDGAFPKRKEDIAKDVLARESITNKLCARQKSHRPFFKKKPPHHLEANADEPSPQSLLPTEGDSHAALISKLTKRHAAVRKSQGLPERQRKRPRSEHPPSSQSLNPQNAPQHVDVIDLTAPTLHPYSQPLQTPAVIPDRISPHPSPSSTASHETHVPDRINSAIDPPDSPQFVTQMPTDSATGSYPEVGNEWFRDSKPSPDSTPHNNLQDVAPDPVVQLSQPPPVSANGMQRDSLDASQVRVVRPVNSSLQICQTQTQSQFVTPVSSAPGGDAAPLTPDQLRRINQNKQRAMEKKRQLMRRLQNDCRR